MQRIFHTLGKEASLSWFCGFSHSPALPLWKQSPRRGDGWRVGGCITCPECVRVVSSLIHHCRLGEMAAAYYNVVHAADTEAPPTLPRHHAHEWCASKTIPATIRADISTRENERQAIRSRQGPSGSEPLGVVEVVCTQERDVIGVSAEPHFQFSLFVTSSSRVETREGYRNKSRGR